MVLAEGDFPTVAEIYRCRNQHRTFPLGLSKASSGKDQHARAIGLELESHGSTAFRSRQCICSRDPSGQRVPPFRLQVGNPKGSVNVARYVRRVSNKIDLGVAGSSMDET